MNKLDQYREFTRSYPMMQGLRQLPLALIILAAMLQRLGIPLLGSQGNLTLSIPLLFAAILLWFGLGKYYEKTFGLVRPNVDKGRKAITGLLLVLLYAGFLLLEYNAVYRMGRPFPISLSGLFIGFLYFGLGRSTRRGYYTAFGLILILVCFLPLGLGRSSVDPVFGTLGLVFGLTFGIGLLVVSLVDHIRLVRAFHPAAGAGDGSSRE